MNRGMMVPFDGMSTAINLQGKRLSPDKRDEEGARNYFTLAASDVSACKAFAIELTLPLKSSPELQFRRGEASMRSHIHGINRSRILLHVMLNGRRN